MRIADVDFVLVPDWLTPSGEQSPDHDHWMCRWQRNFATAEWLQARDEPLAQALTAQLGQVTRPAVIITHGSGVDALLEARAELSAEIVIGAFVVAPTPKSLTLQETTAAAPLVFSSLIVASDDHPELSTQNAQKLAEHLGSHFVSAGPAGRIDSASGQGPWPEGLMRLGWFLKQLRKH